MQHYHRGILTNLTRGHKKTLLRDGYRLDCPRLNEKILVPPVWYDISRIMKKWGQIKFGER